MENNKQNLTAIADEDLEAVSGGVADDDPLAYGRCQKCGATLGKYGDGFLCRNELCLARYDAGRKLIAEKKSTCSVSSPPRM